MIDRDFSNNRQPGLGSRSCESVCSRQIRISEMTADFSCRNRGKAVKKAAIFLLLLNILFSLAGCGTGSEERMPFRTETESTAAEAVQEESRTEETETVKSDTGILVAYFSCTGTTKALAEFAAEQLNADIFEMEAAIPYTDADIAYYTNCRADQEQKDPSVRPEIANRIENIEQYDTILLGYPIWHGQAPRIISTFLESYDFSGKTILPFCTSHSSGIGNSDSQLHDLCAANWKAGKRFSGSGETAEFEAWLTREISEMIPAEEAFRVKKELTLKIDDTVVPVQWEENASVAELTRRAAEGAIRVEMNPYGGWEQVGSLGYSIPRSDVQLTADSGDIMLYCGNQVVLFYGTNSWSYTKLGHIGLPENRIRDLLGAEAVTITFSAQ